MRKIVKIVNNAKSHDYFNVFIFSENLSQSSIQEADQRRFQPVAATRFSTAQNKPFLELLVCNLIMQVYSPGYRFIKALTLKAKLRNHFGSK